MANNKIHTAPEVKAAQVYDLCVDEMRLAQLTNIEAEIMLGMLTGAVLSAAYNTDKEVVEALKRVGEQSAIHYEKSKQIGKRHQEQERVQIKLN